LVKELSRGSTQRPCQLKFGDRNWRLTSQWIKSKLLLKLQVAFPSEVTLSSQSVRLFQPVTQCSYWSRAAAIGRLHQPMGLLLEAEVAEQREVVRGVVVRGQAVRADLLLRGDVQQALHAQSVAAVPDVVQSAAALSGGADRPRGVGGLRLPVGAQQLVRRVQAQSRGAEPPVDFLRGLCVEVSAHDQGDGAPPPRRLGLAAGALGRDAAQTPQQVGALRAPQPLPAAAGLQVGDGHAQPPAGPSAPQRLDDGHLVGGQRRGRQPQVSRGLRGEARAAVEQSAAVRAVVLLHVQTGGPGLGHEAASVAEAGHDWLKGVVVVIHLLQAQDVGAVGEDLLQDQVLPLLPVERVRRTAGEAVLPLAESWKRGSCSRSTRPLYYVVYRCVRTKSDAIFRVAQNAGVYSLDHLPCSRKGRGLSLCLVSVKTVISFIQQKN